MFLKILENSQQNIFFGVHWRYSVKQGAIKNFANLTGKNLCWSLFLIKLNFLDLQLYQDVFSRRLQDMPSRGLQDVSSRRLENVFRITIFHLLRRLQDVFKTSCGISLRRLEDVLKINRCLLDCVF